MSNTIQITFASIALLVSALASAQPAEPPTVDTPATSAETAAAPPAPSEPPPSAEPANAGPTVLADRVTGLEAKLGGLEEASAATDASVSSLKKIKLSGYIQGRYEHYQTSIDGLTSDGKKSANADRFLVRRARLKAVYEGKNAEYLLQIDATGDGVTLKDAEATFVDTWTPLNLRLTVGQFKVPFGHELLQSSGDREMPERSGIVKAYFDGERDRGMRLAARWEFLRVALALINGNGVKDTSVYNGTSLYGTQDPNKFKDFVGRLGVDFGSLVGGVSAYLGRGPMESKVTPATETDPLKITNNYTRRTRLGADVQGYLDVPEVGGLALKGEIIWGSEAAIDWNGVGSDPAKNVRKMGFIVTAVQNIGDHVGVVVRLDQFDPNTAKDEDKVTTLGGGVLLHVSGNLKATLAYAHPMEEGTSVDDDVLTAQLQAKF